MGCEPTYEELKLEKDTQTEILGLGVASLPMRNWNYDDVYLSRYTEDRLRAYLWGIETTVGLAKEKKGWSVASLPMRNWNLLSISAITFASIVASLPMRNWNSKSRVFKFCGKCVASLPMRNWNIFGNTFYILQNSLRAYLWGIETLWTSSIWIKTNLLRAYLWGIETHSPKFCSWLSSGCEPTYEELKLLPLPT